MLKVNESMKEINQKGFVQIPLLVIFVIAVVVIGGAGYLGIRQYQSYRAQNNPQQIISETNKATSTSKLSYSDVDKLKQEIEELKKQQSSSQSQTQSLVPKQEVLKGGRKIIIDHTQHYEPSTPSENVPTAPSQSQILQDQANQALLDTLEKKDIDEAWERFYSFNDAWRENPARNCRNEITYSYGVARLVIGALQDNLMRKYGKSLNWLNAIEFTFKSWCLDRGY